MRPARLRALRAIETLSNFLHEEPQILETFLIRIRKIIILSTLSVQFFETLSYYL
jgi:hypothetical protein